MGGVDYYKLTDKGIELRNASAATKMPRTKANQIIVSLLKRVEEANAMDFAYRIPTVIVYGSYVRGETFRSDVDIAVELEGKWDSDEEPATGGTACCNSARSPEATPRAHE
jgi:hypothetical protein